MNKIRELRKQNHITQDELAKKSMVSRKALSSYENGIGNPTRETLTKIATALNCKVSDLVDQKMNRLKARRKELGLTQKQVAEAAGLTCQSYQRYECGKVIPTAVMAVRIAKILETTVEYLYESSG